MDPEDFDASADFEDGDEAGLDCGLVMSAGKEICLRSGTKWCDWDCPYNSVQQKTTRRLRRRKPDGPLLELMQRKP